MHPKKTHKQHSLIKDKQKNILALKQNQNQTNATSQKEKDHTCCLQCDHNRSKVGDKNVDKVQNKNQDINNFLSSIQQLGLEIFYTPDSANSIHDSPKFSLRRKRTFSFKDIQNYPQNDQCIQKNAQYGLSQDRQRQQLDSKYYKEFHISNYEKYSTSQFIAKLLLNKKQLHARILTLQKEVKVTKLAKEQSQRQLIYQIKQLKTDNEKLKAKIQKLRSCYQNNNTKIKRVEMMMAEGRQIVQRLNKRCLRAEQENMKLMKRNKTPNSELQSKQRENITRQHTRQVQQMVNRMKKYEKNKQACNSQINSFSRLKSQFNDQYLQKMCLTIDQQNQAANNIKIKEYKSQYNSSVRQKKFLKPEARRYSQIHPSKSKNKSATNQIAKQNGHRYFKGNPRYSTRGCQQQDFNDSDALLISFLSEKRQLLNSNVRSTNSELVQSKIESLLNQMRRQLEKRKS